MSVSIVSHRTLASANMDWDIDAIVAELRALRDASLAARDRVGRPVKLPSRRVLASVVESLTAALFPNRLSSRELEDGSVDYFVGHMRKLQELTVGISRVLSIAKNTYSYPTAAILVLLRFRLPSVLQIDQLLRFAQ